MAKEKYVQVCPKCKSVDIMRDKTLSFEGAVGMPSMYICNKCGHSGYAFPEVAISELNNFKESVEEKKLINIEKDNSKLVDTNYGEFQIRFIWKILGPLFLILSIVIIFRSVVAGLFFLPLPLYLIYIAYFKKRKIKPQ